MPDTKQAGRNYLPGLDGLRAISVLAVIAYHLNFSWAKGGFLGVVVFFVLSGYLITSLLLREWEQRGKINLKKFWIRRVRRLMPALLFMMVVVMAYITIFAPSVVLKARSDFLASLFFVNNWWSIFHKVSYFESFGMQSPFNHLWSLAVEEQFYILWPFVLVTLMLVFRKKANLLFFMIFAGLLSAVLMALLYQPDLDPSRVYYGTDTRIFSLLIGGVLAAISSGRDFLKILTSRKTVMLDLIGITGLIILLLLMMNTSQYSSFLYRGGMMLTSLVCLAVMAALANPASLLSKALGTKLLRWIGIRSYGIYLWQYPIIILTTNPAGADHFLPKFLQLIAIIMIANISWVFIEKPIMNGALKNVWEKRKFGRWSFKNIRPIYKVSAGILVLMLCICSFGLTSSAYSNKGTLAVSIKDVSYHPNLKNDRKLMDSKNEQQPASGQVQKENNTKPKEKTNQTTPAKGTITSEGAVTMIGDSILADVAPVIQQLIPDCVIEAKISRQFFQAKTVVQQLKAKGLLGETVVIELGTNGAFTNTQMDDLLKEIGERKIIFINTRVPQPWEQEVNAKLSAAASASANIIVLDWHQVSNGHPEYFYNDHVHPNLKGGQVYARMIAEELGK